YENARLASHLYNRIPERFGGAEEEGSVDLEDLDALRYRSPMYGVRIRLIWIAGMRILVGLVCNGADLRHLRHAANEQERCQHHADTNADCQIDQQCQQKCRQ